MGRSCEPVCRHLKDNTIYYCLQLHLYTTSYSSIILLSVPTLYYLFVICVFVLDSRVTSHLFDYFVHDSVESLINYLTELLSFCNLKRVRTIGFRNSLNLS